MSLVELIDAMEDAGTVDLRGGQVVRWALKVIGDPSKPQSSPARWQDDAKTWVGRRRPPARPATTTVPTTTEGVRIMDAWWPLWVKRQFKPSLGNALTSTLHRLGQFDPRRARSPGLGLPERRLRLRRQGPADRPRRARRAALLPRLLRRGQARLLPASCCANRWPRPPDASLRGPLRQLPRPAPSPTSTEASPDVRRRSIRRRAVAR